MDELMNVSARMGAAQGSRASNAMPELAGVDMRALEQQASTLWKFLDGLAESDPAEYARFIERQAAAASEETARSMAVPVRDTQPGLIVEVAVTTQCRKLEADSSAPSLIATAVAEQPSGVAVINLWAAKEGEAQAATCADVCVFVHHTLLRHTSSRCHSLFLFCTSSCSLWLPEPLVPAGAGVPVPRTAQGPVHMHTTCWDEALVPLMELRSPSTLGVAQHYHAAVHATTVDLVASGQPLQMSALMAASACQWVESKYGVKCVGKPVLKVRNIVADWRCVSRLFACVQVGWGVHKVLT